MSRVTLRPIPRATIPETAIDKAVDFQGEFILKLTELADTYKLDRCAFIQTCCIILANSVLDDDFEKVADSI